LDIDPRLASQIVSDIRSGAPIDEIGERVGKLHSLPRSNVIAHYGSAQPLEMDGQCDLIAARASVTPVRYAMRSTTYEKRSPWGASTGSP
jgi:hypothetical protein